ncbi:MULTISPECIES: sensor histidine kinase [Bacillus]|uniref:sensor histidine kinase n=1 Tax=Bacillus TaxID=1386 RepID=UPI000BED4AC6|nr:MULTISPECIES: HAMP domain-containing sensor histidine kinase [Bacillus]MCX2826072.1 HAMP domain-containing sensor histidine kinase [Bacillus sp. DHT2]MDR4913811.1 HAMP domain-containing sensor histidine kinase [Bacillus pseudomycoides]MED4654027.1 HAMP domain-containing sensor histidine kinase [Bacillus pseudomycoides]PEE03493.1 two-component sensor histidine kinase [Bacillus pseudomycoides]PEM66946.1 two-component sensor histidine kinase [Bacillus pseudomycoides]
MKRGIVLKLFMLTTALCMLILATIFAGQTIFFKQFYANKKVDDIKTNMKSFETDYLNRGGNSQAIQKLEQDFYREHNTWITTLDSNGNLKNVNDFYIEVKLDQSKNKETQFANSTITIPLYNFKVADDHARNIANEIFPLGETVTLQGIEKNATFIPFSAFFKTATPNLINLALEKKINEIGQKLKNKSTSKDFSKKEADEYKRAFEEELPLRYLEGKITKVQLSGGNEQSNFAYTNNLFMERIQEFQADLLLNKKNTNNDALQEIDYEQNDIKYKLIIKPIKDKSGAITYIFSMTSLQPVDEAVQMIKEYYVYIIMFVLLLIFLASFYYSKKIARPLLQINKTTKKIANLDFSERVPVMSKDEIGDLSQNINLLSNTLHSHIEQLQRDIEKEKQLEHTRKEFISGVSHELKTPLSIMKSCISILKDGVASHKKEYYFKAMEKEVDKMDMLIVDMLELAKFESGTYKMQMDVFYIDQAIQHICEQLSLEITKKQLSIHTHLSTIEVIANYHRIEQVLTNFITNAIRYTPEKEDIIISIIDEPSRIKVCIENKGTHIEEDQLDKIWDRFYRVDTARKRSQGGTGLGLAISKNILELHGAEYGVHNTVDGVLFYFYLQKKV